VIPCWLYSADGRALFCVYVQTPMPVAVNYGGRSFAWNSAKSRYEATPSPVVFGTHRATAYEVTREVPEDDRPAS
jgi:hypothetical protein